MSGVGGEVARATALVELGRPAEALRILGPHLAREPQDVTALCLSAQAELALNQNERAAAAARAATAAAPESEWAWRLLSLSLVRLRYFDDARAAADTAVRLQPALYQAHAARAEVYTACDRTDEAAQSAARAIEIAPNVASNWVVSGNVELKRRDLRNARADFTKALSLDPNLATARNNLAVVDLRGRRLGRAIKGFSATARADARSELAVRNLRGALNYGIGLVTILVWLASAIARTQVDAHGFTGSSARAVIACAAAVPVLAAVSGYVYLRRTLGRALGSLLRDITRRTWRAAAAMVLVVAALGGMLAATVLPPGEVQGALLAASGAAFGALIAVPRRLP